MSYAPPLHLKPKIFIVGSPLMELPDVHGRYHCVVCGRFCDPPTYGYEQWGPHCRAHNAVYPGGLTEDEYDCLIRGTY